MIKKNDQEKVVEAILNKIKELKSHELSLRELDEILEEYEKNLRK
jgi:hypothetical protein